MLFIQDILMPHEKILHYAKVHYILYAPGLLLLAIAVIVGYYTDEIGIFLGLDGESYARLVSLSKFLTVTLVMMGVVWILRAYLKIYSTELIVTDKRVIVKVGISTATTAEIDRTRISSVVVYKSLLGRILDYGWISILGYSGDITGLPAMGKPHQIQKYIYQEIHPHDDNRRHHGHPPPPA